MMRKLKLQNMIRRWLMHQRNTFSGCQRKAICDVRGLPSGVYGFD